MSLFGTYSNLISLSLAISDDDYASDATIWNYPPLQSKVLCQCQCLMKVMLQKKVLHVAVIT
jgi:hypothetical protein